MKLIIKGWMADKIDSESKRYMLFVDCDYFNDYNRNAEGNAVYHVQEVLAETEKAIKVKFETGSVDGGFGGWTTWLPKSTIIEVINND